MDVQKLRENMRQVEETLFGQNKYYKSHYYCGVLREPEYEGNLGALLDELYMMHVPKKGKSNTFYGEILKAVFRIKNRYQDRREFACRGEGLITCRPPLDFLRDFVDLPDDIYYGLSNSFSNVGYENSLDSLIIWTLDLDQDSLNNINEYKESTYYKKP